MQFQLPSALLVLALSLHTAQAADDKNETPLEACTVRSASGSFYDLRPLSVLPPGEDQKPNKNVPTKDWLAKGHDYHEGAANFTLNICAPVIGEVDHVVGVEKGLWGNVSAHYTVEGKTYSIGSKSSTLTLRGRRLVLQYTDGSPCESSSSESSKPRLKSTLISFHCDKDPLATLPTSSFSYVGVSPDECSYSFEVLSSAACITSPPAQQSIGPGAVFFIIGVIAILVYFLGGVFYQRNVAHARGWRQLPNYSMWAGIGSFIKDMFIIATSSCASLLPRSRGYSSLSISADGHHPNTSSHNNNSNNPRGRASEDENRLIDQLDEEWDD